MSFDIDNNTTDILIKPPTNSSDNIIPVIDNLTNTSSTKSTMLGTKYILSDNLTNTSSTKSTMPGSKYISSDNCKPINNCKQKHKNNCKPVKPNSEMKCNTKTKPINNCINANKPINAKICKRNDGTMDITYETEVCEIIKPKCERLEKYDMYRDAIPPNNFEDIFVLTDDYEYARFLSDMVLQRIQRKELWFIYVAVIIINVLIIVSAVFGILSSWYKSLNTPLPYNFIIIGVLWLFALVLSFGAIPLLWKHIGPNEFSIDFRISVLLMISCFLTLAWSVTFFQGHSATAGIWLAELLLIYQFWLLIYAWNYNMYAGLCMIPLFLLHGWILYVMIYIARHNENV